MSELTGRRDHKQVSSGSGSDRVNKLRNTLPAGRSNDVLGIALSFSDGNQMSLSVISRTRHRISCRTAITIVRDFGSTALFVCAYKPTSATTFLNLGSELTI
jgi:hypothetical protein